jgi:hypothetical protein
MPNPNNSPIRRDLVPCYNDLLRRFDELNMELRGVDMAEERRNSPRSHLFDDVDPVDDLRDSHIALINSVAYLEMKRSCANSVKSTLKQKEVVS